MSDIPINLVFEDILSEAVLRKVINVSKQDFLIGRKHNARGYGWIKKRIDGFNSAARGMPYLVLTDLDRYECPPILIRDWLHSRKHHNLLLRVAVRQVEAWLLACRTPFAKFLAVNKDLIPFDVDQIADAKSFVINLAKKSRKKTLRLDIIPEEGTIAKIGPNYNTRLIYFVERLWDPNIAKELSPSLRKTMEVINEFEPIFESRP